MVMPSLVHHDKLGAEGTPFQDAHSPKEAVAWRGIRVQFEVIPIPDGRGAWQAPHFPTDTRRQEQSLTEPYPPSRTSVAGLPSDDFVPSPMGTSIKSPPGGAGGPVSTRWVGAATGGRGYVGLLAFWMFTLAETRWWHLKQVDDGVPVLRDLSKQRGLSERTTDAQNFVSHAQHEVRLEALLRHSQDGRGLSSMGAASTLGFMCRRDGALLTKPSQPLSLILVGVHFVCKDGVSTSGIAVIAAQGRGRGDSWPRPR